MANHTFVEIDLDEAQPLADLAGIRQDLQDAQQFARRLEQTFQPEDYDSELVDSLSTSMLIRYARAFSPGVRAKLDQSHLDRLSEGRRASHEKFIYWRSKHVSHSVNSFEHNQPVARFTSETVKEEGIQYISVNTERIVAPSPDDITEFLSLTDAVLAVLEQDDKEEHSRLLEIVRAMPVEEILNGPSAPKRAGSQPIKQSRTRGKRRAEPPNKQP